MVTVQPLRGTVKRAVPRVPVPDHHRSRWRLDRDGVRIPGHAQFVALAAAAKRVGAGHEGESPVFSVVPGQHVGGTREKRMLRL
jgi:hypothetical protein